MTEDDAQGRSRIVEDAPATAIRTVPQRPGYRAVNVWRTESSPAPINAPDTVANHKGISPPKGGGTILRIIDFPPEPSDPEELRRIIHATFGNMYQDAQHDKRDGKHPGMHRTDTVDYAIVLEGEIYRASIHSGEWTVRLTGAALVYCFGLPGSASLMLQLHNSRERCTGSASWKELC